MTWVDVCPLDDLTPNRGVAALFDDRQVAVFLVEPGDELVAVDNVDPFTGAAVLSRGIIGSAGDVLTVASPVHKQRFDLRTGRCLDDSDVVVATVPVRVEAGVVQVQLA
jgi:nitrite reductase (NADH) small subunit